MSRRDTAEFDTVNATVSEPCTDHLALKAEQGITDDEFYHYDIPLTVKHESEALVEAGFSSVVVLNNWGATYTIKAVK